MNNKDNGMKIEKLYPECKDYLWGGEKLKRNYGKKTDKTPCAESWELSFHKDGLTRLFSGKTLAESVGEKELGEKAKKFPFFPVLILEEASSMYFDIFSVNPSLFFSVML